MNNRCNFRFRGPFGQKTTYPEYVSWAQMLARCGRPNHPAFKDYGGRGITVHGPWKKDFFLFLFEVGRRAKGMSIERIDNNIGYFPGNVRWANKKDQARNRRSNRYIEFEGKRLLLEEWSVLTGIKRTTLLMRMDCRGWSVADSLTIPVQSKKAA